MSEDIKDEDINENVEKGDKKDAEDGSGEADVQNSENAEKSVESPTEDDEQAPVEEKLSIPACKDNKDIVKRENLRSVFQKFGTVKGHFFVLVIAILFYPSVGLAK
ncbi:hypothetical protein K7X08_029051 [Anisodus acutangulus]|uniref:Uncharacterized protein n=1 Tax=Anisodus acutangulus TaxID=402998 RepID=A0A9Q1L3K7_9SOLA|nr:hypothetical protein K7X08_029051 [Anisodus acutangulus]